MRHCLWFACRLYFAVIAIEIDRTHFVDVSNRLWPNEGHPIGVLGDGRELGHDDQRTAPWVTDGWFDTNDPGNADWSGGDGGGC